MKEIRYYFILFLLPLLTTSCIDFQPQPEPEIKKEIEKPIVVVPKRVKVVVEEKDFVSENYVKEDKYTKVFTNCFKTGKIALQKKCKADLRKFLKATPLVNKRKIILEIHTDMGGSSKKNLAISKRRAYSTAASLYYKDYKHSEVYYKGFGESQPLYNSVTKKANFQNRRLIVFLRGKNEAVNSKKFKKFVYTQKNIQKTKAVKLTSKVKASKVKPKPKSAKVHLIQYSGEADTGWIYFGKKELKSKFEVTCANDKPIKMRRKSIAKSKKSEFISGLYSKRISGNYGDNYVEIYPVYVYDKGYLPKSNPIVTVYGEDRKVHRYQTTVNTYRGTKGILYRIFINGKKEIKCMDLVLPYKTKEVSYGRVYTVENSEVKESRFIRE